MDDPGDEFIHDVDDDTLEALLEAMYLAAFADGEFSENERTHFAESVASLTRGRLAGDEFERWLSRVVEQHASGGRAARVSAIKDRLTTPDARRIALVLASDMAAADGVLHEAERELILSLAEAFDISHEEASELLEGPPEG